MTRIWEFTDNRAIPSDLVREQDFILRIRRLQRLGTPHFVVNLALNNVETLSQSRRALETVEESLKEFAKITNGVYIDMSNGDAFIIWEETADAPLLAERLVGVMRPEASSAEDPGKFLTVYHLPIDYTALRERANYYVEVVRTASMASAASAPSEALKSEAARGPLTAWSVDQIGKLIHDIDLSHYARTQPIFHLEDDQQWTPVREEFFVSFDELRRDRFPKLDIITPEHLFLALCETIDQQLLVSLHKAPEAVLGHAINLNLSVAAVMGSAFSQFALGIPYDQRPLIAFELHRGDLLQDFGRTLSAIETLKKENFKVALDGITPDMVNYVNIPAFEADFIKINVAKDRVKLLTDPTIQKGLSQLDPAKIIFFRCDSDAVLAAGKKMGVRLFQGWLIDDIVHGRHN